MSSVLIKSGKILGGNSQDILIQDHIIVEIADSIDAVVDHIVDAKDCVVLPGLVDLHTHLREPGKEGAETIASGSFAAARGGFTAVSAMANTTPVADNAAIVEQVWNIGREIGLVDVFPIGAVTKGLTGKELSDLGSMSRSQAKVGVFSDDGHCVSDSLLMRRALEYVKQFDGVIAQHAQDPALTQGAQMNEGSISAELGLKGWPRVAEESIIARDILLAEYVGARLHICHVTTAGGVELIRWAKSRGISVTAEVTPHHLLLTDELVRSYDPVYKVNPPLRTNEDVLALRAGLADGTIDIVATDHAPHPQEDKECEWQAAAFGMLGLETALAIVNTTMVQAGLMGWTEVADRMSVAPAKIGRYEDHGNTIEVGAIANLAVINPTTEIHVDRDLVASRSKNTPFHAMTLKGAVVATLFKGALTHKVGA
jgi:dihydroorotase